MLTYLFTTYSPGGVAEKQTLLKSLEDPAEISSVQEAPGAIRKWMRWRRRAKEVGAVEPDPALLLKGLNKMTRRVLESHRDIQFRVSLVRNTLSVDTTPTSSSVDQLAAHLLAELEQCAMTDKRSITTTAKKEVELPKLKNMEAEAGEKGKGKGRDREKNDEEKSKQKCRYYLTEGGCRKGRECTWSHEQRDELRRCYVCGSSQHLAPSCTRPKSSSTSPEKSAPKAKQLKTEEEKVGGKKESEEAAASTQDSAMKDLIDEASKVLKSISGAPSSSASSASSGSAKDSEGKEDLMERLQQQLNSLRQKQKVLRLQKMATGDQAGLIDSGATHPLRPQKNGEVTAGFPVVGVSLADGRKIQLKMSPGGAMISPDPMVEPIVPMGPLAEVLGCEIAWKDGKLSIRHPLRGDLKVSQHNGCPQVSRQLALDLISELEDANQGLKRGLEMSDEFEWLQAMVKAHPVLSQLPDHIKERLAVQPGDWHGLPCNRRWRRAMQRDGLLLHLYAGEDSGFTFGKAWKQCGGEERILLEVDVKRGSQHDMIPDDGVYASLITAAIQGKILGIAGGPNCRSRSVLRHYEIPGCDTAPRPVRAWKGEEYGKKDLSEKEKKMVEEDDILLWRQIFLFMIATYARRARGHDHPLAFVLEQPSSPRGYKPEVVSFWDQWEWHEIKKEFELKETHFTQKSLGGEATKPTTLGTSLDLVPEDFQIKGPVCPGGVRSSKDLARWPPGLMRMLAVAIKEQTMQSHARIAPMSWEDHIRFGHVPYRKDCKTCQETLQQQEPHRRARHLQTGTLSLDVAGPFTPAYDLGGHMARWFLTGVLVWRVPKDSDKMRQPPDEELQGEEPAIEEVREAEAEEKEEAEVQVEEGQGEQRDEERREDLEEKTEVRIFRLALPMTTKTGREVSSTTMDMLMKLKVDGFTVAKIHTDRGHEFSGPFRRWASSRGIILSRTAGDDPRANGRAEVAVKAIKTQIRRVLHHAKVQADWWPWALRYINEINRCVRLDQVPSFPPFLEEVRVRKRTWRRGSFDPMVEHVRYLCPSVEEHGHWVWQEGEAPRIAKVLMKQISEPVQHGVWVGLETQILDDLSTRRRLREKTTVRRLDASMEAQEEEETEKWKVKARIRRIIEEEMRAMVEDDEETAMDEMAVIGRLRKAVESMEDSEEILQTKIISPKEVWEHWEEWEAAAKSEINSMLEEKEALEEVSEEEVKEIEKKLKEKGIKFECIPSKVVYSKKPIPGGSKHKVRWVICGNYEEKRDDEQTYSAGADATAFRLMLWFAARNQWLGMSLDIRTAFLNAVIDQEDQSNYILVAPPTIFVKKGCLRPGTLYRPKRAVYGLRRSPRLWGLCRDSEMRSFEVEVERKEGGKIKLQLRQLDSEPNLWRLEEVGKEEGSEPSIQYGLVMTYVDDIFITGPPEVTRAVAQKFQATWTTSEPEVVGEEAIRFLGMEVSISKNAEGRDVWHVTQESFVKDLVKRQAKEVQPKKIPITRDQALMTLDASPPTLEKVRECQKVVGELLWVLTRTRPDLMYSISRLGPNVTKATSSVLEAANQVQGYLLKTCAEGLRYQDDEKEPIKIQVFSDVSYAPSDEESFGCFIITLNRAPFFWRSGRQHLVTLSTAEAELAELVEAMTAGESVAAIVDELIGYVPRGAFTDSQSALAIITTDGGNWRTRHLRTRASYARQTVLSGRWVIHHSPGEFLTADIGTKPLSSKRLETLREMMMMGSPPKKEEIKQEEKDEEQKEKGETLAKAIKVSDDMIRLVTTIAILAVARGDSEDEEEEGGYQALQSMLAVFAIFMVLLTLLVQWLWKVGVQIARRQNLSPEATGSRPEVRGEKMGRRGGEDGLSSSSVQLPPMAVEKGLGFGSVRLRSLAVEKGLGSGPVRLQPRERGGESNNVPPRRPRQGPTEMVERPQFLPREEGIENEREENDRREETEVSSTSSSEESSDSLGERIENGLQNIEAEVAEIRERLRISPPEDEPDAEGPGFGVLTTRYGKAYHLFHQCPYLTNPRVGPARPSRWCTTCRLVTAPRGRPPPGFPVLNSGYAGRFHTDFQCPHRGEAIQINLCVRCAERIEEWAV